MAKYLVLEKTLLCPAGETAARLFRPGEEISYNGVPGRALAALDLAAADAVEARAKDPTSAPGRERVLKYLSASARARLAQAEAEITEQAGNEPMGDIVKFRARFSEWRVVLSDRHPR